MKRRFLISILLFLIFIAVTVYVLVTAQGTKIDSDGRVVNTSILRINSVPQDITVYINDKKVTENGNRVEWLEPGITKVTLKKAGYRTWEKEIELKAGLIEDIYAQLSPERLNFDKLTSVNVDKFFFSNNTDYIFYSVINGEKAGDNGIWKLKLKRNILDIGDVVPNKIYNYSDEDLKQLQDNAYSLLISDDNQKILVDIPALKEVKLIDSNTSSSIILNEQLSFYPSDIKWLRDSNFLIASNGKVLVSYNINSKIQTLIYYSPNKEIVYSVGSSTIYYYRYDKDQLYTFKSNLNTESNLPKSYVSSLVKEIKVSPDNDSILYINNEGGLNFIDLDKKITIKFETAEKILNISPNGFGSIYKNISGDLKIILLKNTADLKDYISNTYNLTLKGNEITNLFYTPSGKNIVVLTKDQSEQTVWFIDNDGLNPVRLITKENIANNNIAVADTGLNLYVLLIDNSDTTNDQVNNIYRYNLEAE